MHDHLRDMGREIADQEKPGGHLWRPTNDINDLWQQSSVISEVRGIRTVPSLIDYDEIPESEERLSWFKSLCDKVLGNWRKLINTTPYRFRELQLVATEDGHLKSILKRVESPDLIWVRWNNCPSTCLPSWIPMKNIRVLQVVGKQLKSLWRAESQAPLELRELNIYATLSEFPKSIGRLKHIEKIAVERSNLQSLPEELCHLQSLKHLLLSRSHSIESLPDSFGCLTSLQELDLSYCGSLQALLDSVGGLTSLQELNLSGCGSLQTLLDFFGCLTSLRTSFWRLVKHSTESGSACGLSHPESLSTWRLVKHPTESGSTCRLSHLESLSTWRLVKQPRESGSTCRLQHPERLSSWRLVKHPKESGSACRLSHHDRLSSCSLVKHPRESGSTCRLSHLKRSSSWRLVKHPTESRSACRLHETASTSRFRQVLDKPPSTQTLRMRESASASRFHRVLDKPSE